MDPHGQTARRFPLIARFRPACLPLPDRVQTLVALADTAHSTVDQGLASAVFNQAALIASDVGLPDLARKMCHQHAAAYLHACPLPATSAIRALEPVVNLARLQIRAGQSDDGRKHLLRLYEAVGTGAAAHFEGVSVPSSLTAAMGRREVRAWLWRVILADGTRTLTTAGRWEEALDHLKAHHGIGKRMLDGRQVAVLAALTTGEADSTVTLLIETEPGDPWEQAVTACLTVLCHQAVGRPVTQHLAELVTNYVNHKPGHGTTVFDIRLGLTILDTIDSLSDPAARRITEDLYRRTMQAHDGYAAREILASPSFTALATHQQTRNVKDLIRTCALGNGALPSNLRADLTNALRLGDRVIRSSLQHHPDQGV
ncbi:hypothetical protein ACIA6C_32670 [Streptomyces sp. NPDC051578]|uniref:hypothetical protein n=1 Tax=Streptomyces sp. NPDC051578 TaxID=3365662 RepID=UPI0037B40EAA